MSVSLWVENSVYEIGSPSFFKSFFSTIYVRIERQDWGSYFPVIMNDLYIGELNHKKIDEAIKELETIRMKFKKLSPEKLVWDFEDFSAKPPWGDEISPAIISLENYFWTSNGENLFDILMISFKEAKKRGKNIIIR